MKPRTILLISAFFKTIFYGAMLFIAAFYIVCILVSCSPANYLSGEKACRVISKKYDRGHYYSYTCITLFSKEKVYLTGFEVDANLNDTVKVVVTENGFNYFKKGR